MRAGSTFACVSWEENGREYPLNIQSPHVKLPRPYQRVTGHLSSLYAIITQRSLRPPRISTVGHCLIQEATSYATANASMRQLTGA